jgi:hypothetical protein
MYYDEIAEINKALAGTSSSFLGVLRDSIGNAYTFALPRVRYGNPTFPREGSSIISELPFVIEAPTAGTAIRIEGFPA